MFINQIKTLIIGGAAPSESLLASLKTKKTKKLKNKKKLENIAREVCKNGNSSGIVFNAANEIAVKNFLEDEISFNQIYDVIYRTFETTPMSNITDIESIYEKDIESRMEAKKVVKSIS